MNAYQSFAVIKTGGSHAKNKIPCQDACFGDDFGGEITASIAVVADGHGDENCFRSDRGSKLAVECARRGIHAFIKQYQEYFSRPFFAQLKKAGSSPSSKEFEKIVHEKLLAYTVRSWNTAVWNDYEKNPFTGAELEKASAKYRDRYEKGESIAKAYGTSLIAAAITPQYWFGFHVGDGRLTALYADGSFDQPVPWDPKCYLNVTTSLCDDDILERDLGVRSFLSYHADRQPPVALFLCSDGVDDNYPVDDNEKHLFKLYRMVLLTFAKDGFDKTVKQLEDLAEAFATKGKGDDTSIAGFVSMRALKTAVPIWERQIAEEEAAAKIAVAKTVAAKPAEPADAPETPAAEKARQAIEAYKVHTGGPKKSSLDYGSFITKAIIIVLVLSVGIGIGALAFGKRTPTEAVTTTGTEDVVAAEDRELPETGASAITEDAPEMAENEDEGETEEEKTVMQIVQNNEVPEGRNIDSPALEPQELPTENENFIVREGFNTPPFMAGLLIEPEEDAATATADDEEESKGDDDEQ